MIPAKDKIFRYLDTDGDGGGTKNANVNGSVTPVVFKIVPGTGEVMAIHRIIIHVEDTGILAVDDYGAIAGGLAVGCGLELRNIEDDAIITDMLDGLPVKNNHSWSSICYDTDVHAFGAAPAETALIYRLSFSRIGDPLIITGDEYLAVVINDDCTGLVHHYFMAQGEYLRR